MSRARKAGSAQEAKEVAPPQTAATLAVILTSAVTLNTRRKKWNPRICSCGKEVEAAPSGARRVTKIQAGTLAACPSSFVTPYCRSLGEKHGRGR